MNWLLFSYYSPGVFFDTLICMIIVFFLIFKKEKVRSTYWLIGFFIGEMFLFGAYTASYSIFAEFGAYHRYFSCLVMFGNACLVGFSYYYPKNDRPKEAIVVISISFLLATIAYIHFVLKTLSMEKMYSFKAQIYTFDFGKEVGLVIVLLFVIPVLNLLRKTIRYSEYKGFFSKWLGKPNSITSYPMHFISRFLVGIIKIVNPKGKDAESTRDFAIPIFIHILIALLNVLVKSDKISYDLYALLFSFSTMIVIYYIAIAYINNSPEPTSFMVKLVGISLGAILVVLGYVGDITLSESEVNYNEKRLLQTSQTKLAIARGSWDEIPSEVEYVLIKPATASLFSDEVTIVFTRNPLLTLEEIAKGESIEKKILLKEKKSKIKEKNLSEEDKEVLALNEISKTELPEMKRLYRNAGFQYYTHFDFIEEGNRYEVGFSLLQYRRTIHQSSRKIVYAMVAVVFLVLTFFPMLFKTSLVRPLNKLLTGVKNVNDGDLTVQVPVKSYDEIGFLSVSFNSMVRSIRQAREELQDYAENLENKVEERTKEVREKMELIEALKVQQDGDYFLTSLLAKPLFYNANKSKLVKTEFIIKQKKQFEFKRKQADLGGDICITGNLRLGTKDKFKRYTMAMNGDAMGKSMQGAGGSLVMGVVMNSIMARSASQNKILNQTPEEWLFHVYTEIHSVFKSFNGSMVISAVIFMIEDETGKAFYINAEHPYSVLYRDGKASFIEEGIQLRKIGFDSDVEFKVNSFQLEQGDVVILGSDGRDDIDLSPNDSVRTINEDETLFLGFVEKANTNLNEIIHSIEGLGHIIDDLSLLRIGYKEDYVPEEDTHIETGLQTSSEIMVQVNKDGSTKTTTDIHTNIALDTENAYLEGKALAHKNRFPEAISTLYSAFVLDRTHQKLSRLLGILCYKTKEYKKAIEVLNSYTSQFEREEELLYYLAISYKKMAEYNDALAVSTLLERINPNLVRNLLNLSDVYRLLEDFDNAKKYCYRVLELEPENEIAKKLKNLFS